MPAARNRRIARVVAEQHAAAQNGRILRVLVRVERDGAWERAAARRADASCTIDARWDTARDGVALAAPASMTSPADPDGAERDPLHAL